MPAIGYARLCGNRGAGGQGAVGRGQKAHFDTCAFIVFTGHLNSGLPPTLSSEPGTRPLPYSHFL